MRAFSVASLIAGTVCLLLAGAGRAQTALSTEQLSILQNLSPEQQAALFEAIQSGTLGQPPPTGGLPTLPGEVPFPGPVEAQELTPEMQELLEEPRIEGGDTIVVRTAFKEELDPDEIKDFLADANLARLLGSRAMRVSKRGVLELPGVASVPLAGLSAEEVAIRLSSERLLDILDIEVTILPLSPTGAAALEPFGYALFDTEDDVFGMAPAPFLPVPRDYVIGPGDVVKVQLYGNENYEIDLIVNQDGTINFPRLGPRPVAGLTFGQLKDDIERRVSEQLIGTLASVSLGELRSIRVFAVGDVKRPGAYTVSGLSRVTNALFASGGTTEIGSLRQIQLKRNGRLVQTLDLYDLLLRGDTSDDAQLQSGDVVLIPPAKIQVGVDGEVKRPAIYELKNERTLADVIELAGGLLPTADTSSIQLERITSGGRRRVETLSIAEPVDLQLALAPGDLVRVFPVIEEVEDAVFLDGHVTRAGSYEWTAGMTITDLLPSDAVLKPFADLGYVLIRRERGVDRQVVILSADLRAAQLQPGSEADVVLQNRDRLTVFELGVTRSASVAAILAELEAQATSDQPLQAVKISGQVRAPGSYPLESGMRVSDLLRAGGGLNAAAFSREAELTRYVVDERGQRQTRLRQLDLAAIRAGDESADVVLVPYDYVNIKEIPEWEEQIEVEVLGEVMFPGVYPVTRGESMTSVLARAGGLTDLAFPSGSVFTRRTLQERETQQIEDLANRLESDLVALALQAASAPGSRAQQAYGLGQSLLEQLRSSTPTGRLVIDLPAILNAPGDPELDIALRNGDTLLIPPRAQEITVLGEVQYTTSHLFDSSLSRTNYIDLSGGMSTNADKKRVYVVRANGAVVASGRSRWFRGRGGQIYPGDTIVVPLDTDRLPQLQQWSAITQIIYNLAIAVAAVNSF
jgi:protein involved in polysaccharide export with SLBB domain